jgi:hypothetical protein
LSVADDKRLVARAVAAVIDGGDLDAVDEQRLGADAHRRHGPVGLGGVDAAEL